MTGDGMVAVLVTLTGVVQPDEQHVTFTDEGVEMAGKQKQSQPDPSNAEGWEHKPFGEPGGSDGPDSDTSSDSGDQSVNVDTGTEQNSESADTGSAKAPKDDAK